MHPALRFVHTPKPYKELTINASLYTEHNYTVRRTPILCDVFTGLLRFEPLRPEQLYSGFFLVFEIITKMY